MMQICAQCGLPIPAEADNDAYCTRQCFDDAIDAAIVADCFSDNDPILLTKIKYKECKLRRRVCDLRDDAERRVANIDSYETDKLILTRTYFQSRADVLNDLLMFLTPSTQPCSCC